MCLKYFHILCFCDSVIANWQKGLELGPFRSALKRLFINHVFQHIFLWAQNIKQLEMCLAAWPVLISFLNGMFTIKSVSMGICTLVCNRSFYIVLSRKYTSISSLNLIFVSAEHVCQKFKTKQEVDLVLHCKLKLKSHV